MFDLLKQDVKVGNKVKLFLVTGKEPEGIVLEIGENFIVVENVDGTKNRFFDKIIGGWIIVDAGYLQQRNYKSIRLSRAAKELDTSILDVVSALEELNLQIPQDPNYKLSEEMYQFLKSKFEDNIINIISPEIDGFIKENIENEDRNNPLTDSQIWNLYKQLKGENIRRKKIVEARKRLGFSNVEDRRINIDNNNLLLDNLVSQSYIDNQNSAINNQLAIYISPNAEIDKYNFNRHYGSARNQDVSEIRFKDEFVFDESILDELKELKKGDTIPIICDYFTHKENGLNFALYIIRPDNVGNIIVKIRDLITKKLYSQASKLINLLKTNKIDLPIIKELKKELETKIKNPIKENNPIDLFNPSLDFENDDPSSMYEVALKLRLKKLFNDSEKIFLELIEMKFQLDSAVKNLADQYREQGRILDAIHLVEKYFNDFEKKEQGFNFLYDLYTSNGDLQKARNVLEKFIDTDFDEKDQVAKRRRGKAYARLGALVLKNGELKLSQTYFEKAEELYPQNKQLKNALRLMAQNTTSRLIVNTEDYFDENLFDSLVYGISPFLRYALDNCTYEGIPLSKKDKKTYNQKTISDLRNLIEKTKEGRPEIRAKYYLTESRVLEDIEKSDDVEYYKALAKYCNAMAKILSSEKGPIETIREFYLNAFSIIDDWSDMSRQVSIFFETFYSNQSKIVLSDGVGIEKAILSIGSQIYSKSFFWNSVLELFINSKQATAKVLNIVFQNRELKNASIYFLNGLLIQNNKIQIQKANYIELWKEASRKRKTDKEEFESKIKGLLTNNNVEELANTILNNVRSSLPSFLHELDLSRINAIFTICEHIKQYFSQETFDDKEFYYNNIQSRTDELNSSINQFPTGISISSILPLSNHIQKFIENKHLDTINSSKPIIDIRVEGESVIDEEKQCEVQVSLINSSHCSKAGEIHLEIIDLSDDIEGIIINKNFDQNLRGGGEPFIAKFIIMLNDDIINQGATDIKLKCTYKELATNQEQTIEKRLSISFYNNSDFMEISNPYAELAKSNIVENPKMFKGRSELIERICETILSSKSKGYVIYGQKRSGKSSVLWHLENNLNASGKAFAIYFSTGLSIAQDESVEANFYYVILSTIERRFRKIRNSGIKVPDIGKTNRNDLLSNPMLVFYDRLNDIKDALNLENEWRDKKLVLIIDEFTYIYYQIKLGNISPTFMQNWKAFIEDGGFSVVLSGQDTMLNFISDFQNEFAMFKTERLTYLELIPAKELVEEPIWDTLKDSSRYTRNSVDRIIDLTACSPFYLQIICNELVRFMNNKRKPVLTPADIEDVIMTLTNGVTSLTEFDFENLLSAGDKNLDEVKPEDAKSILKQIALQTRYILFCRREDILCFGKEKDDQILSDLLKRAVISEQAENPNKYKIEVQLFKQWLLNHN